MPSRSALKLVRLSTRASTRALSTRAFSAAPAHVAPPPVHKLGGRACWVGEELAESAWWGKQLGPAELAELDRATKHAMAKGIEFDGDVPLAVSQADFPLSKMAELLSAMAEEIEDGTGVTMLQVRLGRAA